MTNDPLIWDKARAEMPLPALMRATGDGEFVPAKFGGSGRDGAILCPFCQKRGKFGLFVRGDRHGFKCQSTGCEAHAPDGGHGEIGWLMLRKGLSQKDACVAYLDLALPDRNAGNPARESAGAASESEIPRNPARDIEASTPWHVLWKKLVLNVTDTERETAKRGLSPETLEAMGIASNVPGNRSLVESLSPQFPEQDLLDLGILKCEEGAVRVAGQLCGWGRTGKFDCECGELFAGRRCPKCDRKAKDEKAQWLPTVQPPLIPYFGTDGAVQYLRPHKGGVSNAEKKFLEKLDIPDDDDIDHECAAHVWVQPNFAELLEACEGTAVLTEGEWKGGALMQTRLAAMACPGITFIRNPVFRQELVRLLRFYKVKHLVVIFDNEVKDDPSFPDRYQPDPNKQHDTQLWAEYTLQDLFGEMRSRGGSIRVGRLPDAERIAGKADFDSILGRCVREHGMKDGTKAARRIFRAAIAQAVDDPASEKELFPGAVRRIIDRRLHLLRNCKRKLRYGDSAERELAKRFAEWDPDDLLGDPLNKKPGPVDKMMSDAFKAVHGCYYVMKSFLDKETREQITGVILPSIEGKISAAKAEKKYEQLRMLCTYRRAYRARLRGKPESVGSCVLRGAFQLKTANGVIYMVRAYDQRDTRRTSKSPLLHLSADDWAQPGDMKKWMGRHGHNFTGGVNELDDFRDDILDEVYLKDIHSITYCCHHEETRMWFGEDCAFLDDRNSKEGMSLVIKPDENGVIWNPKDGLGYLLDSGREGGEKTFALGLPRLFSPHRGEDDIHADKVFAEGAIGEEVAKYVAEHFHAPETKPVRDLLIRMESGEERPSIEALLAAAGTQRIALPDFTKPPDRLTGKPMLTEQTVHSALEDAIVRSIFRHLRDDMPKIIGDLDAWMALGVVFGYAIGPALVDEYYCHPGLWVTGDFGSGKSETTRRMLRIWGMRDDKMVNLPDTSSVGLTRTLANYGSGMLLCDEYRKGDAKEKKLDTALRAATERGAGQKGTIASKTSTASIPARTSPIVSGQHTPQDSATASRYVHITFSKARRQPGSSVAWERYKRSCRHFYHVGRWLMMRRAAFEKRTMAALSTWMNDPQILHDIAPEDAQGKDRVMLTTGASFACFVTMSEMLGLPLSAEERAKFQSFAIAHGGRTLNVVSDETFRNRFWRDVITGLNTITSGIKRTFFDHERFVTLKFPGGVTAPAEASYPTAMIRQALTQQHPSRLLVTNALRHKNATPVLFIAIHEVYDAWQRDLRTRGEECPISFQNLRAEIEREDYFIPPSKALRHLVHYQRFTLDSGDGPKESRKWPCWCISLERHVNADGTKGDYIFEPARELIHALGTSEVPAGTSELEPDEV